jgi:membrane protein
MADRKPESPTDLRPGGWWSALKRSVVKTFREGLTDRAAALTYYALLALFPALIALVAVLGVVGQEPETSDALLDIVAQVGSEEAADVVREPIQSVVENKGGAGALLGIGLLGSLWAASGYIGAFTRAANEIWEVREGRPSWKLKPLQLLITLVAVILVAVVALLLVVSGPVLEAIGDVAGLGDEAVTAWRIAKWPVMALVAILLIALLYNGTANVRARPFRWVTPGAVVALVGWAAASVGFAFYVSSFGSYNATYGSLGAVVILLVWLWITNLALLVGLQVDAELERQRGIVAGKAPEDALEVPEREPAG